MDGDSSTTDASQLGITGEYMASSHYVLQPQEGKEKTKRQYKIIIFIEVHFGFVLIELTLCVFHR